MSRILKSRRLVSVAALMVGTVLLSPSAAFAQTTFASPVTRNEANYYGFDRVVQINGVSKYHAGIDLYCSDLKVMAANCGTVVAIIPNGQGDRRFGNTVIVEHSLTNGSTVCSSYSHLASFAPGLTVGRRVLRGERLGTIGKTGYSNDILHLHFEIKVGRDLGNPLGFGGIQPQTQFAYMPVYAPNACAASATAYGYINPNAYYGSVWAR